MSRSYRAPYATQGYKSKARKKSKRDANKKARKAKSISNGKAYRKEYNSWDICDWKFPITGPKAKRK